MGASLEITPHAVRRYLLEKQGLRPDANGSTNGSATATATKSGDRDILSQIRNLECVQIDPVAAVERNQHLALFARMPTYRPSELEKLLQNGMVFEYWANAACVIPMEDYAMFEVTRRRMRERLQPELDDLGPVVRLVLERLEADGPLPAKAFATAERVRGYWDNASPRTKATSHALNLLYDMGCIEVVRREGVTRFFDIREKVIPKHLLSQARDIGNEEAQRALLEKYMRAYRVFDPGDARLGWHPMALKQRREVLDRHVRQGTVTPLAIKGVRRSYYMLAEDVDSLQRYEDDMRGDGVAQDVDSLQRHMDAARQEGLALSGPVRFLPPLDNLLWRRERIEDLFHFSYTWEVYLPAVRRRYGYYALPILAGNSLIGRIDPRLDREHGRLVIRLLQLEAGVRWSAQLRRNLQRAIETFAHFHGATESSIERTEPEGLSL